jgi:hypothetical protein
MMLAFQDIWEQASEIQEALTEQAQHRSASIPDLIVAATARARNLEILLRPGLRHHRPFHRAASTLDRPTRHGLICPHSKAPPVKGGSNPLSSTSVKSQVIEITLNLCVRFAVISLASRMAFADWSRSPAVLAAGMPWWRCPGFYPP